MTVSVDAEGRAVVVKAGSGPAAGRLRHEAEVLEAAVHVGVVEVLSLVDEADDGVALTTAFAGTAVTTPVGDPAAAVRVLAGVAGILADLHDRGVVHGRVTPDHVLLGAGGTVVLCGFGGAAGPGAPGGPRAGDDVAGLAALGDALLAERHTGLAEEARAVLDRAATAGAGAGPTMRTLATALAALGGTASPGPRLLVARRRRRAPRRLARSGALALGGVVLTGAVGLALAAVALPEPSAGGAPGPVAPAATSTPAVVPGATPASTPTACPPAGEGAGCDDTTGLDGTNVWWRGARWSVSRPGEVVAVGDWNCDGAASPAVLRPEDGSVWVYRRWDEAEVAVAAGTVPGAVRLRNGEPDAEGCPTLLLERHDGTSTSLVPPG